LVELPTNTKVMVDFKAATIYPNPFTDGFEVKNVKSGQFFIYDLRGNLMESGKLSENSVIGKNLSSGVYMVNIQSTEMSSNFKIIKQ
jgi:hypothetical protein